MKKRYLAALASVTLALLPPGAGTGSAGLFRGPYDFSLGPYPYGHGYSYNEAYGYGLPFTPAPTIYTFPTGWNYYRAGPYRGGLFSRRIVPVDPANPVVPPGPAVPPAGPAVGPRPVEEPLLMPVPVPGSAVPATPIVVEVRVPPGAELWFDGKPTRQTGPDRVFSSPPVAGGKAYHYEVKARWVEGGRPVEQSQVVDVQGGQRVRVLFPAPRPQGSASSR